MRRVVHDCFFQLELQIEKRAYRAPPDKPGPVGVSYLTVQRAQLVTHCCAAGRATVHDASDPLGPHYTMVTAPVRPCGPDHRASERMDMLPVVNRAAAIEATPSDVSVAAVGQDT